MKARDVMSKPVISVHPDTPLREFARLLLDKEISAVPPDPIPTADHKKLYKVIEVWSVDKR